MPEPVRVGIVGCGSVMQRPYMTLLNQLRVQRQAVAVVACDVRPERRSLALDKFGFERFTTDYREVVNADDVDLVLVLTSMPEHGPITRAALEAGKHVLVEKPMAVTLEEAAEIVALAKQSPGYLVPAPHVILSPTYQAIWRHIHRGDIGKPYLARALYGWAGPNWGQWFYRQGGGALFDLGVYNVVSLTGLLGPAKRVSGFVGTAIPEREVEGEMMRVEADDNAHVLIDFGDACYAVVTTGFTIQRYRTPAIEIYGSKGTIQMMGDDWDPEGYELWRNEVGAWQVFEETHPNWPWTDGLRHLVECIQTGQRPIITPEHAFHVLEIMIKAQAAGRDGQARPIESTFTPPNFAPAEEELAPHLIHDRSH
ncbi:MAG TPA: Gfo/Idh/MocA family oxidoreductase [Caldilineaceae bacterium]|nr:Gfo/Idh/MocA family oxidoreductase [Caldilineaceae bacterium]